MNPPVSSEEARAAQRFVVMNAVRAVSILGVIAGLAMARNVIPGPYLVGAALAIISMVAFFFAPPLLAKRCRKTWPRLASSTTAIASPLINAAVFHISLKRRWVRSQLVTTIHTRGNGINNHAWFMKNRYSPKLG